MKRTKKTDAATPANSVTVTDSALTKVSVNGATITLVIPTKEMPIPEMVAAMVPYGAEFNRLATDLLSTEKRARLLYDKCLLPALEIFREWHDKTSAKERKRISPTCNTLTQFKKAIGISDSLDRVRDYRAKQKALGTEFLKLEDGNKPNPNPKPDPKIIEGQSQGGGNKDGRSKKPDTKKLEDEQKEKERLEREQATAKLLRDKAAAEQNLKNANVDLSVATNYANDNPADSDPLELEAAQAKVATATAAVEEVSKAIAAVTPEAPATDSNTVLSDFTQAMRDTVRETVAKGAEVPADHTITKTEVAAMIWDVRSAKRGALIIAYTETEAMAMAPSLGFAATSCVNVTEPVVAQFDVNGDGLPSTVYLDGGHPTTVKKSVHSETLTDEQVEKVG